jgi:Transcriptional regulator, AbiEi antitoxin
MAVLTRIWLAKWAVRPRIHRRRLDDQAVHRGRHWRCGGPKWRGPCLGMPRTIEFPVALRTLLHDGRGVFTTREAAQVGVSDDRLQRLVRAELLVPVAKGVFASAADLNGDPWLAHAIRTRGFVRACGLLTLATGWSAVAVRSIFAIGPPPRLPTVVRAYPARRGSAKTPFGVIRATQIPAEHYAFHAGCPIVSPAWMVCDLARTAARPAALIIADAVLRTGTNRSEFLGVIRHMYRWPGVCEASWIAEHADGRAESGLETLGRLGCIEGDLPVPLSNVWVGPGYPLYRLDHLFPWHWVAMEGDGALKYDGPTAAAVVQAEKEREWFLRRLGLEVMRYGWDLAYRRRAELTARVASVLAANPVRPEPIQWWTDHSDFAD